MRKLRIDRRIQTVLAVVVILLLILTTIMPAFGEEKLKDIKNSWAKNEIEKLVAKNILSGYVDNTFKPEASVSRIEAVVMVTKLFNKADIDATYNNSKSKYQADFKKYNISTLASWAEPSLVFALERGMINRDLLSEFIKNGKVQNATRVEIAICLAKGLDIQSEINLNPMLTFNDVKTIPNAAKPYVDLLIKKGIINGKGDDKGNFNPLIPVNRASMAKMLSVASDLVKGGSPVVVPVNPPVVTPPVVNPPVVTPTPTDVITTIDGKVYDISNFADNTSITIVNAKGEKNTYSNKSTNISVKWGEEIAKLADIKTDMEVSVNVLAGKVYGIKLKNSELTKEGYFSSNSYNGQGAQTLGFRINDKYEEYKLESYIKVTLDGIDSSLYKLSKDDKVSLKIVNSKLTEINATSKSTDIYGTIKYIDSSKITLTKDKKDYDFSIDKNAKVERNNKTALLSEVRAKDTATLKLEYGKAMSIDADSVAEKVVGILKEVKLSSTEIPQISVQVDNELKTFKINPGCTVSINSRAAGLYDVFTRINNTITLRLESDVVTGIESDLSTSFTSVTGKIVSVDTRNNVIEMTTNDNKRVYINYKDSTADTLIQDNDGTLRSDDRLSRDDIITVTGEDKLGSINAKVITRMRY